MKPVGEYMSELPVLSSRRTFLGASTGAFTSACTFLSAQSLGTKGERLRAGLIGCGGRGTQAVVDMLVANSNVELVAITDLFPDQAASAIPRMLKDRRCNSDIAKRINVPADAQHSGFDGYRAVLEANIDIAMLCTPPAYRPLHFEAAVAARKHVFAEKPIATDPAGVKRFLRAVKQSQELKLTVVSGADNRSAADYCESISRIHDGDLGQILSISAYFDGYPVLKVDRRDPTWSDTEWQHRNWYSFIWICGDQVVEQHFHGIDTINWLMDSHPVSAMATGGCAWRPREPLYGNIYDHNCCDYTYPNGVHFYSFCRQYPRGLQAVKFGELAVGTKGQRLLSRGTVTGRNPKEQEHIVLVESILGRRPYVNVGREIAESTLTCIMARESAYSGKEVTWDDALASNLDLVPVTLDLSASLHEAPLPVPGKYVFI